MSSPVPGFGHAMLAEWALDPAILYLNHGTVGATPRRVLAAQRALQDEIERQPARFQLRELSPFGFRGGRPLPRLREAANRVAEFLGARGEDVVFVDNATAGANAVVRSLALGPGDEILVTDLGYGGVSNAARWAARRVGAELRTVAIDEPARTPGALTEAIAAALGPRTRLAIVDLVASSSALLLPASEIAARCRERGVATLIDAAHGPGAIPLSLPALGADYVVANLHKWAWAPRSSGILWARPELQPELHPPVVSWGLDLGFAEEFDLVGTRDPTPHLTAPAALDWMEELGVGRVQAWNHDLAWRAARLLAERWGTAFEVPESMVGTMATIPLPERLEPTIETALALREALHDEDGIEVQLHALKERIWVRISAQIYNEIADYERLASAVAARI